MRKKINQKIKVRQYESNQCSVVSALCCHQAPALPDPWPRRQVTGGTNQSWLISPAVSDYTAPPAHQLLQEEAPHTEILQLPLL